jgi:hypothetical protein
VKYFTESLSMKPSELPQLASIIKRDLKAGKLSWEA